MLTLFVTLFLFVSAANAKIRTCGKVQRHKYFAISDVTSEPKKQEDRMLVTVSGVALEQMKSTDKAEMEYSLSVLGLPFHVGTLNLCDATELCTVPQGEKFEFSFHTSVAAMPAVDQLDQLLKLKLSIKVNEGKHNDCVEKLIVEDEAMLKGRSLEKKVEAKDIAETLFKKFVQHFEKKYENSELVKRAMHFEANVEEILKHNAEHARGLHGYTKGINQFSDLSNKEFEEEHCGCFKSKKLLLRKQKKHHHKKGLQPYKNKLFNYLHDLFGKFNKKPITSRKLSSDSVDWDEQGAVNTPMQQGTCGGCWSFSTTGALEGAYYVQYGELLKFSEQELVSCDTNDNGCGGGLMDNAFKWVEQNGLVSETDYPYASANLKTAAACDSSQKSNPIVYVSDYTDVEQDSEEALMEAVQKQPVSIAVDADALQSYESGVMTSYCGTTLDHGVLLVGYGTDEETGQDYWKIKNSWGTSWGEDGFVRIARGVSQTGGQCGILMSASYPTVDN